jgi:hypothetical protein
LPGSEVLLLLGGELVEAMTHGFELETRNLAVEVLGHNVYLRL